jgi:hypothetical protein
MGSIPLASTNQETALIGGFLLFSTLSRFFNSFYLIIKHVKKCTI